MSKIIAIDPGLSGAIALLSDPDTVERIWDMPVMEAISGKGNIVNPHIFSDIIKEAIELGGTTTYVELVQAMGARKNAKGEMVSQGVASTFKFGVGFGVIQGALAALGLPINLVAPQKWKKYHKLSKPDVRYRLQREPTQAEFKDACRLMAIECFPNQADNLKLKKHDGRADAIMIGRFAYSRI